MRAGGRGYTRPPSLVSVWSTAPFLLNNSVGKFDPSPSVDARMRSFQDSIEKLLWPEKREKDRVLGDKGVGLIDRTTTASKLFIPGGYLPEGARSLLGPLHRFLPWIFGEGGLEIGPIPAGTPVDLLANLELVSEKPDDSVEHTAKLVKLLAAILADLKQLPAEPTDDDARRVFEPLVPQLWELSKCRDFVVNRGHYFGTSRFEQEPGLDDGDKRALIEFIKTF